MLAGGIFGAALFVIASAVRNGRRPGTLLMGAVLITLGIFFSSMTVKVDRGQLAVFFGPGFAWTRFPLKDIERIRYAKNPWYYGWGIHLTPHGWLYNVSGHDSVEIGLSSGKTCRIGTDEPEMLMEAVRAGRET